jgi:hypothetical protein
MSKMGTAWFIGRLREIFCGFRFKFEELVLFRLHSFDIFFLENNIIINCENRLIELTNKFVVPYACK